MEGRKVCERAAAVAVVLLVSMCNSSMVEGKAEEQVLHSQTFLSQAFELGSGDVLKRDELMDWVEGHIAWRSFDAEVVDENGISVPLFDVYLHHWGVFMYHVKKGYKELVSSAPKNLPNDENFMRNSERLAFQKEAQAQQVKNYGTCVGSWVENFGQGTESRKSNNSVPAPYGFITGDVDAIPEGYEEAWYLEIHAINTEGIVDKSSCYECRCKAYNITADENGGPLSEGYEGGSECCTDKAHCNSETIGSAAKRKFFLKYTITYVDWDLSVIPLRMYHFDVIAPMSSQTEMSNCQKEYDVKLCDKEIDEECIDHRHLSAALVGGGDVIFARLHQHIGGVGGVVYEKDGKVICRSEPIYGTGDEAGNEAGYVVGMTTCTPELGTMFVEPMKELQFECNYSSEIAHTGAMNVFVIYVAEPATYIAEVTE